MYFIWHKTSDLNKFDYTKKRKTMKVGGGDQGKTEGNNADVVFDQRKKHRCSIQLRHNDD